MLGFIQAPVSRFEYASRQLRGRLREWRLDANPGYCNICEGRTVFIAYGSWLRDTYKCRYCQTIPRNRALVNALNRFTPEWKSQAVHESSPGGGLSEYLKKSCRAYSSSHFFPGVPRGTYVGEHRSEDLAALTFPDASFDIFVTSDVFEHVANPAAAFREIARVLKPEGVHVFTMPWYPELEAPVERARVHADGTVEHLLEPVYHGNPISDSGALVTFDWGRDFPQFIRRASGMTTTIYLERDRDKGLDAEFLEVFVSRKPA